jgi:hypothetical protein
MTPTEVHQVFHEYRAVFDSIYDWFHSARAVNTEFALYEAYVGCHQRLTGLDVLIQDKYRFIDLQVLETMQQPLFLVPVSFIDAFVLQDKARGQYPSWFNKRDLLGVNISPSYRKMKDGYYLRWHSSDLPDFKHLLGGQGYLPPLIKCTFQFSEKQRLYIEKHPNEMKPNVESLLDLLYAAAVELNMQ